MTMYNIKVCLIKINLFNFRNYKIFKNEVNFSPIFSGFSRLVLLAQNKYEPKFRPTQ